MNLNFKGLLYTIISTCAIFLAAVFFIRILPYILLFVAGIYLFIKVKSLIRAKKSENQYKKSSNTTQFHNQGNENSYYSEDNDFSGEVIDVDYEETNDKED